MNGFEFLTKVREIRSDIKILLITAFEVNDMKSSLAISSLKINEFIVKPILDSKPKCDYQ